MTDVKSAALNAIIAAADLWDRTVERNAAISSDAELAEAAQRLSELIGTFYQQAGRALLDEGRLHSTREERGRGKLL